MQRQKSGNKAPDDYHPFYSFLIASSFLCGTNTTAALSGWPPTGPAFLRNAEGDGHQHQHRATTQRAIIADKSSLISQWPRVCV
jgi:hypothetical protein